MGDMADWIFTNGLEDLLKGNDYYEQSIKPPAVRPHGPGECPICKAPTKLRISRYGKLYGCIKYPLCIGSRNFHER